MFGRSGRHGGDASHEREAAPEWLFERRPLPDDDDGVRSADAGTSWPVVEHLRIPRADVPALTVIADAGTLVAVTSAAGIDWSIRLSAMASSEPSRNRLLRQIGGAVFLDGYTPAAPRERAVLRVEAPADAPLTLYVSYGTVDIRDISGPVRAAVPHGRITLLDTGGDVDATAGVIDFAGSRGRVVLSANAEINLKMTADRFEGSLLAWAEGPVRVRLPADFRGPFEALVSRADQFVCRGPLCRSLRAAAERGLWRVTYRAAGRGASSGVPHLRSERATVVIDQA